MYAFSEANRQFWNNDKQNPSVQDPEKPFTWVREMWWGRSACHYCGPCHRGCATGSYFSSQSSTLPAARATGTLKANAVVERLEYDPASGRLARVNVIDSRTRERQAYRTRLFLLCASTVGCTQILMNSTSEQFTNGLANRSGDRDAR